MRVRFIFLLLCFSMAAWSQQEVPFERDVNAFEMLDRGQAPPQNPILFIGSSSFTYWSDLKERFPGYTILNRAFGGSTLQDQIYHFDKIVPRYHAKQIVIYCGENDFAYNDTLSVNTMVNRFKKLFSMIRQIDKNVFVTYVSMKPSPSRKKLFMKYEQGNQQIEQYLKKQQRTSFVDVYHRMMQNGKPIKEIFGQDSLHMNRKGYDLWTKTLRPYLRK